jgi:hypothetical protein
MYMTGSKRTSLTSSETSTIVALSPTNSETSTEIAFTPTPNIKTRHVIYRTPSPINLKLASGTPETPTVVLGSPTADELPDYSAPFGTPEQSDERVHEYTPAKTKRTKLQDQKGGKATRKRRRRRRTYKRGRKTV